MAHRLLQSPRLFAELYARAGAADKARRRLREEEEEEKVV